MTRHPTKTKMNSNIHMQVSQPEDPKVYLLANFLAIRVLGYQCYPKVVIHAGDRDISVESMDCFAPDCT